jgi:hypothetical protein
MSWKRKIRQNNAQMKGSKIVQREEITVGDQRRECTNEN